MGGKGFNRQESFGLGVLAANEEYANKVVAALQGNAGNTMKVVFNWKRYMISYI